MAHYYRFIFFVISILSAWSAISIRLIQLQWWHHEFFLQKSINNFTSFKNVNSLRGNITDTKGRLLATNKPCLSICWKGTGLRTFNAHQHALIEYMSNLLADAWNPKVVAHIKHLERYKKTEVIISNITTHQLTLLLEKFSDSVHLIIQTNSERWYPHHTLASHIVGYTHHTNRQGTMGIERLFEHDLEGSDGYCKIIKNSFGSLLSNQLVQLPLMGADIQTTIDNDLQTIAQRVFPSSSKGAMIVMDPKDGALRVVLSSPSFDPDLFLKGISASNWQQLQEQNALLNRAFNGCYPPASLFKLVSISAALEHDLISPLMKVRCKGSVTLADRKYHCANRYGHGVLGMHEALAYSCNILFFYIGKHLSIDMLAEYAHRFGLGLKTGVSLVEHAGLVPSSSWKRTIKHERWWQGDTLSCAIGQSYLLVTPLQIARMFASIFEGYLVTPRIIEQESVKKQPLNIQSSTLEFLQESMKRAASHGTGRLVGRIKDMTMYAKTGTAETSSNKSTPEHTWFIAYFIYKNTPLVLVILVEKAGHTKIAVNIAKNFLIEYKKVIDQE